MEVSIMRKPGKYRNYLRKSYIRYASILMLIMLLVFFGFNYFNLWFTTIKVNRSCNHELSQALNEQYSIYVRNLNLITRSYSLRRAIVCGDKTDAYRNLYSFAASQQIKCIFYVFDSDRKLLMTNLYFPNQILLQQNTKIKEIIGLSGSFPDQIYNGTSGIMYDNGQRTAFLLCKAVVYSRKVIGYLCFDMTEESLDNVMSRKNSVDMLALTDRFDYAFYYTSKSIINTIGKCRLNLDGGRHNITVDDKPYYGFSTVLPDCNIKVITLSSTGAQNQVMKLGIFFLLSLMVLMGFLVAIFAKKAAQNNSSAIEALLYAVQQGSNGNIDYRISSVTFDEFQIVYDKFNEMMLKLQTLIQHNSELLERKRMMEVSRLEKQFNPHFVFNVLEMLKYEILINPSQASRMVVAFANLMRYSINDGNVKVRLKLDLSYVKDYLMLQKMRFNKRLSYNIIMEEELAECRIPKLLIQPIVENCLSHGIENVKSIEICIVGKKVGDIVKLTILDNGCGIPEDRLKSIHNLLQKEDLMPSHIGLYNIQRQIKLLYGDSYGLAIDSQCGKGTTVQIQIPFERSDTDV